MSLMKEFLSTPGITLTSLGSILSSVLVQTIMCTTRDAITTDWVCMEKLAKIPGSGVVQMLQKIFISFVRDLYKLEFWNDKYKCKRLRSVNFSYLFTSSLWSDLGL